MLWPLVSVWLRQSTASFQAALLLIPVVMLLQAMIIWVHSPECAGKQLDEIAIQRLERDRRRRTRLRRESRS